MPDLHSKHRGQVRADRHIKSVVEEKFKRWGAGLRPVLRCPSWRKKVDITAMLSVLRPAAVHNPRVGDSIVQVWIVLVVKRARLERQFLRQKLRVSKLAQ